MNVLQVLRNRIRPRFGGGGQDLALYRHLRRAENNLHAARDSLAAMLVSHKNAAAKHRQAVQVREDIERLAAGGAKNAVAEGDQQLHSAVSHQQDCARHVKELNEQIERLTHDVSRLETEYQSAQMDVRRYFYLEACPGNLQETGAAPGQPAQ